MRRVIRESAVESALTSGIRALDGAAHKLTSQAGLTDRIIILPFLPVWFVEVKRPTGKLDTLQIYQRDWLLQRGHLWAGLYDLTAVSHWLAARAEEIAKKEWMR